jgi:hypothetical protein
MERDRGERPASAATGWEGAGRLAVAALVVPLVAAGSFVLYVIRGAPPRVGGALSLDERRALRRAVRAGLRRLERAEGRFRLSEAVRFPWRSLQVISNEDPAGRCPGLDDATARQIARQVGDVLVLERAPGAHVWIALGPSPGVVGDGGLSFGATDVIFTPAVVDGIRHLRLTPAAADGSERP